MQTQLKRTKHIIQPVSMAKPVVRAYEGLVLVSGRCETGPAHYPPTPSIRLWASGRAPARASEAASPAATPPATRRRIWRRRAWSPRWAAASASRGLLRAVCVPRKPKDVPAQGKDVLHLAVFSQSLHGRKTSKKVRVSCSTHFFSC